MSMATLTDLNGRVDELTQGMTSEAGQAYKIYGDSGYKQSSHLLVPWTEAVTAGHGVLARYCRSDNYEMSKVRETVEWGFGLLYKYFARLKFQPSQQLLLQRPDEQVIVATFLLNCHNCLHPNETAQYFRCEPPTLAEYTAT